MQNVQGTSTTLDTMHTLVPLDGNKPTGTNKFDHFPHQICRKTYPVHAHTVSMSAHRYISTSVCQYITMSFCLWT